jgi:multidrug efflux pump subunit AcrA (membrane-fusion protein)
MARFSLTQELSRILLRLGLGLGFGLLMWFVTAQVITHTFSNMQEEMLAKNRAAQAKAQAQLREVQAQQEARRLQRQHRQTMSEEEARRQAAIESQRAVEAQRARIDEQRQHDAAWESFYKPMRGCEIWQSDSHMVECQNHKIRAKREFEQKWAAGELSSQG